jgi:hypothetical protein
MKHKVHIYINVAIINNVGDILNNIVENIFNSGLYDFCDRIFLIVNGDLNKLDLNFLKPKFELIVENDNVSKCEFPTISKIWKDCNNEEIIVLYLHTKGVSKPNDEKIKDWVNLMIYFNIIKWEERVNDLKNFDCSGVNLNGNKDDLNFSPDTWGVNKAPLHYSGNFWWSKSDHIKKLPNPYSWVPDDDYFKWRVMCEMWLCQIEESKYKCAWQSNVNHYHELYPKTEYCIDERINF